MNQFRFFPRSLKQLVVLAFLLVSLPLLILAGNAYLSLNELSHQALNSNQKALLETQHSQSLINMARNLERPYYQYCVLRSEELEEVYKQKLSEYNELLQESINSLDDHSVSNKLLDILPKLSVIQCNQNGELTDGAKENWQKFFDYNSELVEQTKDRILSQGKILQTSIIEKGEIYSTLTTFLFILSLLLFFLFTRMIIAPVNQVKEMIDILGNGNELSNYNHPLKGPKEIQMLAKRIMWLSDRLRWLEAQRYEFLRHISHELKTPLASMREGTELLADQIVGTLTADQKDVVAILDNSSRHLQQLIEQLLDYNRRLADIKTDEEWVDLTELVDRVITAHRLPRQTKFMNVKIELQVMAIRTIPSLLIRCLDNLYSNAVYYGAEFGDIWIKSKQEEDYVYIDVANQGDAIPLEERARLFEPFYQGNKQRKGPVKGSGLGLSIAKDSVHRMKGELELVDVDYAAICFRIKLPQNLTNTHH